MVLQGSDNQTGFRKMTLLLILISAIVLSIAPASANTGITIAARGDQSYYLGEEVVFRGSNSDSEYTILFIVNADIPVMVGN